MLKKSYSKTKPVCKVTFALAVEAAPNAERVVLLGDFNEWNTSEGSEMKKNKTHFETTLELAAGRSYEFRYLIDGKRWENDWDADGYMPSPFAGITNSVIVIDAVAVAEPKTEPKATAKPAVKAEPKAAAKPAVKAEPKVAAKTTAKATATTEPKVAAKPAAKTTAKPAAKPAAKTETKPAAKPAAPKATAKPAAPAKDDKKTGRK